MSLIAFYGAEAGVLAEIYWTGTCSISSAVKHTGNYSFRSNPVTTAAGSALVSVASPTTGYVANPDYYNIANGYHSFWFRVDTLPAANSEEICLVVTTGTGTIKMGVRITNTGKLQAWNSGVGGFLQMGSDSATALATDGTWYLIDVYCGNTQPGPYEVRINGVSEISGTGSVRAGNCGGFYIGKAYNRNGNTVDFYYDDAAVDDTAYPGDCDVLRLDPAGDGASTLWTIGAGAGADWQNVDEVPHDSSTTYLVSTLSIGDKSGVTLETLASGGYVSGNIGAVKSVCFCTRDAGGTAKTRFYLLSGATEVDTSADYSNGSSNYLCNSLFFATDPATGAVWTVAGVNAVEIGVIERNSLAPKTRWTAGYLMVCITPSAGMGQVI